MPSGGNELDASKDYCCPEAQEVEQLRYKIDFCTRYMSKNLETFQAFVNGRYKAGHPDNGNDTGNDTEVESVLISIAEMKKIRDILRGTIAFENSLN